MSASGSIRASPSFSLMAYEVLPSSSSSSNNDPGPREMAVVKKRKAGRKKFQETRHPVYKGVRQRNGKWVCELRRPHKKSSVWVGTFSCPEMAARAYDVAALALKGESTALNFPQFSYSLPRVTSSSSISQIRCAAIEAAEAFSAGNMPSPSSSSSSLILEQKIPEVSNRLFIDEEELFNMPGIIAGMAEGLILTPPGMQRGFNWDEYEDTEELSLWSDE